MQSILIIDDEAAIRAMFARALRDTAPVETAADGAEALEMLRKKRYGVVLLDIHMPGLDGLAVLDRIRDGVSLNHDTPVYVISADTSQAMREKVTKLGAACLVSKPVQLGTLVHFVSSTLRTGAAKARLI